MSLSEKLEQYFLTSFEIDSIWSIDFLYSLSVKSSPMNSSELSINHPWTSSYGPTSSGFSNFLILGKYSLKIVFIPSFMSRKDIWSTPSCYHSYTNSIFPLIEGIIPRKSVNLTDVIFSLFIKALL